MTRQSNSWRVFFEMLVLMAMLALAAYLRGTNLADTPGWYTDETTHLSIAASLQQGEWRYLAIDDSVLMFGRLPLFEMILAGTGQIFGLTINTLRGLVVVLELLTILFLYLFLRIHQSRDVFLPVLAALMLTIYPQAVLYHRIGFSYHLLSPLIMLLAIGLTDYIRTKDRFWLLLASGCLGLALVTDLFALSLVPILLLTVLRKRALDLFIAVPVVLIPAGLYVIMMMSSAPDAFLYDLNFTLGRMGGNSLIEQIDTLTGNYMQLLQMDLWFVTGLVGLFLLRPVRLRVVVLLLLLVPIVMIGRVVALYHLSFYYMIPLLPFIATGVAAVIRYGGARFYRTLIPEAPSASFNPDDTQPSYPAQRPLTRAFAATVTLFALGFFIGVPLWTGFVDMQNNINEGYRETLVPFLLNADDVRQVAAFVNARVTESDSVVTSAPIAWLLRANAADFQMSAAAMTGEATPHLPANIPPERFAFNPRYEQATFVIVDDLWRGWGVHHVPGLQTIADDVQNNWLQVFAAGTIVVYQNPAVAS